MIHDLEIINNANHITGLEEKAGENTINQKYPIPTRLTYNRSAKRNANDKIIDIAINMYIGEILFRDSIKVVQHFNRGSVWRILKHLSRYFKSNPFKSDNSDELKTCSFTHCRQ